MNGANDLPPTDSFDISAYRNLLVAGTNVLAIQGISRSRTSTEFFVNPQLTATQPVASTGFFTVPTPGAPNTAGVTAILSDLQLDHAGDFYTSPFNLAMQTDTQGATIRYTTDGSAVPTVNNGMVYTGPILIGQITASQPRARRSCGPRRSRTDSRPPTSTPNRTSSCRTSSRSRRRRLDPQQFPFTGVR